eukprot:6827153-Prymnesium_polylepis.2
MLSGATASAARGRFGLGSVVLFATVNTTCPGRLLYVGAPSGVLCTYMGLRYGFKGYGPTRDRAHGSRGGGDTQL